MKYFIQTFGCAANIADSERVASYLEKQGYKRAQNINCADYIVINTCMVRESAENRVYGLVNNLNKFKDQSSKIKVILTGCMVGLALKDKSGQFLQKIKKAMPNVELLPIEEIGFNNLPIRDNKIHAWVPISNGCNNFCTYCVVPYTRGREVSRPFTEIINECVDLAKKGFWEITLIGQNVNSYGADLVRSSQFVVNSKKKVKPTYVKHLGRLRIPTLFPYLLDEVCKIDGIKKVDFISSNPWDFSDELIKILKKNTKITRLLHLPVQSGDDEILKKMNRWYTAKQYLTLTSKIKTQISNMLFSTDIIVGFPGETDKQFQNTVKLCKKVGFVKAYISQYSDRPQTVAHKTLKDNVSHQIKKKRWEILDKLINKENLQKGSYPLEKYRISV